LDLVEQLLQLVVDLAYLPYHPYHPYHPCLLLASFALLVAFLLGPSFIASFMDR
jgi:hypothetical protein